jgi:serine/threonine-protein kinase RsbT
MVKNCKEQLTLNVLNSDDIVYIRQSVRECSKEMGFNLVSQTKLVTAASELARNMVDYANGGTVQFEVIEKNGRQGLKLIFEDHGPGIPDIESAMKDGFTTSSGLGMGLSGSKRLVNEFEITSKLGEGTRVTILMWI